MSYEMNVLYDTMIKIINVLKCANEAFFMYLSIILIIK